MTNIFSSVLNKDFAAARKHKTKRNKTACNSPPLKSRVKK